MVHLSSLQILFSLLEIIAENKDWSCIPTLIEKVLYQIYPGLVILSYLAKRGLFISHHVSYKAQLYLELVYYFAEVVEPVLCQLCACKQDHFDVGVELI